jgi:hypothetical protein
VAQKECLSTVDDDDDDDEDETNFYHMFRE